MGNKFNKYIIFIYAKFNDLVATFFINLAKNIKYLYTAIYGHFTNSNYPWEKII